MKLRRSVAAIALAAGVLLAPSPSPAETVWSGACSITMTFTFASPVSRLSGPAGISGITGGGTCALTGVGLVLPSISFGGSGSSVVSTCEAILSFGTLIVDFSVLSPVTATFTYLGTAHGGTLIATSGLAFAGAAALASVNTCELGSVSSISFVGTLLVEDPEV